MTELQHAALPTDNPSFLDILGAGDSLDRACSIFQHLPVALSLRDSDQALLWANQAYETLVGHTVEELQGKGLDPVLGSKNPVSQEVIERSTEPIRFDELAYRRADGSVFYADVVLQLLPSEDASKALTLGIVQDVTNRVDLARQQALDVLLNEISADLGAASPETIGAVTEKTLRLVGQHFEAQAVVIIGGLERQRSAVVPKTWPSSFDSSDLVDQILQDVGDGVDEQVRAMPHGEGSSLIAAKLVTTDSTSGVLGILIGDDCHFGEREQQLVSSLANVLAFTNRRIEAEVYFRLAFEDAPVGISLRAMDSTLVLANQAYADFLGYATPTDMIGHAAGSVLRASSVNLAWDIPSATRSQGRVKQIDVDFAHRDGSTVQGRVNAKLVEVQGQGEPYVLSHVEDMTATAKSERALQTSQQRFRDLVENSPAVTILTDPDLRVTYASPSLTQTGWTPEQLEGELLEGIHHESFDNLATELRRVMESGQPTQFDWTTKNVQGERWLRVSAVPERTADGQTAGLIMVAVDHSERRESQAELAYQASHDPVTGLYNRVALLDRLNARLRTSVLPVVFFLDLDRFKVVNDSLGHAAGDLLLQTVAQRLTASVRASSVVARLGGDEFVVLVDGPLDEEQAMSIGQRMLRNLAPSIPVGDHQLYVTASIGIAFATSDDPETVMANADFAMYQAKEHGRNRAMIFDEAQPSLPAERIKLEADLRHALPRGEFELYYQPEIDLHSGAVLGAEALIRWNHPTDGTMVAGRFIDLAEECGLISEIGDWVIAEALQVAHRWQQDPHTDDLIMRINLSAHQLSRSDAIGRISELIDASKVDPEGLCLEITETTLMNDAAASIKVLEGLKHLGVSLAVDDFGTGYSSLSYLQQFPVDILKIDRSFVSELPGGQSDVAIVDSIISLAEALHLEVVAEGVETSEQADSLMALGCSRAQGYFYGRPVPLSIFSANHLAPEALTTA